MTSGIGPNLPPGVPPSDFDKDKKITQSVEDSTKTQKTETSHVALDWTQPEVPVRELSDFLKKILFAAILNDKFR